MIMKIIFTEDTRKIGIKNPLSVQVTEAPEIKCLNFLLNDFRYLSQWKNSYLLAPNSGV